ncbi:MAG TPA: EamA family transporter [Chthoniobacteraceae bacterium]|nr:EamA family transporter [Chthoniobacteraceae bacterium]
MWFIYAFGAAILWGINYSVSGRVMERGLSPSTLFLLDLVFGLAVIGGLVLASGRGRQVAAEIRGIGPNWPLLLVVMGCVTAAGLLSFMAIGAKNATLASLIEISYPLFVAFFAWLFFREVQWNAATIVGGALTLGGVAIVYLGNRH